MWGGSGITLPNRTTARGPQSQPTRSPTDTDNVLHTCHSLTDTDYVVTHLPNRAMTHDFVMASPDEPTSHSRPQICIRLRVIAAVFDAESKNGCDSSVRLFGAAATTAHAERHVRLRKSLFLMWLYSALARWLRFGEAPVVLLDGAVFFCWFEWAPASGYKLVNSCPPLDASGAARSCHP